MKHTFVDEHETEVVACGVFLVDFAESWRQVETAEEQTNGYSFAAGWRAVHDLCRRLSILVLLFKLRCTYLEPHQRLTLVILIRRNSCRLPPDDTQFHMLNLQPHQQEVDPSDNDIFQMILALAVLKLDMQAVLNTHIHLDATVDLWRDTVRVYPDVLFANDVLDAARDCGTNEVAQLHVDAVVGLVLLFDVLEVEGEGLRVLEVARRGELGVEGEELVVVSTVEEHL